LLKSNGRAKASGNLKTKALVGGFRTENAPANACIRPIEDDFPRKTYPGELK
jgi:hypothetical protein